MGWAQGNSEINLINNLIPALQHSSCFVIGNFSCTSANKLPVYGFAKGIHLSLQLFLTSHILVWPTGATLCEYNCGVFTIHICCVTCKIDLIVTHLHIWLFISYIEQMVIVSNLLSVQRTEPQQWRRTFHIRSEKSFSYSWHHWWGVSVSFIVDLHEELTNIPVYPHIWWLKDIHPDSPEISGWDNIFNCFLK